MGKSKILCSILMGLSFCFALGSISKAFGKDTLSNVVSYVEVDDFKYVDILGRKYDLSLVNPSVVQMVIRVFDDINSGALSEENKNEKLKEISQVLNEYLINPKSFENFPTTLDLGPSTLLREEISYVQSRIFELKNRKSSLGDDDGDIQKEIDILSSWINYSVVNFDSSKYGRTFSNSSNDDLEVSEIFSSVYSTLDFEKVFRIVINSDGSFDIQNENISNKELFDIIKSNIEFENYKFRYLKDKMESLSKRRIHDSDVSNEILDLKREMESVKVYGISQEIVLLNMQKDVIRSTRISEEFMEEKIRDLENKIDQRVNILKDFNLSFENDLNYSIESSTIGDSRSYFGYYVKVGEGLGFKIELDKDGKALFNGVYELSHEDKVDLKNKISNEIESINIEISRLESKKEKINSGYSDEKYYLLDALEKRVSVLRNDIDNYKIVLSQI